MYIYIYIYISSAQARPRHRAWDRVPRNQQLNNEQLSNSAKQPTRQPANHHQDSKPTNERTIRRPNKPTNQPQIN